MTIGERIRFRRAELNMSQKELAVKLGKKHQTSVSKVEKGERNLTLADLKKTADALDTSVEFLLGETDSPDYVVHNTVKDFGSKEIAELYAISTLLSEDNRKTALNYLKFLYQEQLKEEHESKED